MDRKTILVGLAIFTFIAVFIVGTILLKRPDTFRGVEYQQPLSASEITLTRGNGEVFHLSGQKGKVVLLFFGYTFCPDECPTTLAELKQVYDGLGDNAQFVEVVLVSVDPGRDTPQHIQEYVNRFNPSFIGLSGSQAELESVWKNYGIFREIVPGTSPADYGVNHTARMFLIDPDGNLRLSYGFQTPVDDIIHDVELILKSNK
jgi:protein SCO1/2